MPTRKTEARWIESRERWQVNVTNNDGVRKTFACNTPGRKGKIECERKADKWLRERLADESVRAELVMGQWINSLKESTSQSHWRQQEGYARNWINPVIGRKKIGSVSKRDLQDIINKAYKEGNLAEKTLKNIRSCLVAFMKYCRSIPCTTLFPEGLTIPRGAKPSEKHIVAEEEIKILFSSTMTTYRGKPVEDPYVYAYRFAVATGMRPGEIIALQWSDIKDDRLTISRSINDYDEITRGKNANARRVIKLSGIAKKILQEQREMLNRQGKIGKYVFLSRDGGYINQQVYRESWKRFCAANGISSALTPYEMRHTFVSIMDEMPEGLKKMVVGHSKSMDTEGIYGHQKANDLDKAAAYIDAAFERILK